jgi:hypothetical protein
LVNFITPILEAIPIGSQRRIFDALAQLVFVAPQHFAMGAMLVPARARRRTAADGITWGAGRGRVTLTRGRGVALRWRRTAGNAAQLAINIGDIAMAATCVCRHRGVLAYGGAFLAAIVELLCSCGGRVCHYRRSGWHHDAGGSHIFGMTEIAISLAEWWRARTRAGNGGPREPHTTNARASYQDGLKSNLDCE